MNPNCLDIGWRWSGVAGSRCEPQALVLYRQLMPKVEQICPHVDQRAQAYQGLRSRATVSYCCTINTRWRMLRSWMTYRESYDADNQVLWRVVRSVITTTLTQQVLQVSGPISVGDVETHGGMGSQVLASDCGALAAPAKPLYLAWMQGSQGWF